MANKKFGPKTILTLLVVKTKLQKIINLVLKEAAMKIIKAISSRAFLGLSNQ
jgi:hypothetical protein